MVHQLTTLDPGGSVPLKVLVDPVLMDSAVHTMLHLQHVQNGFSIHRANNIGVTRQMLARKQSEL